MIISKKFGFDSAHRLWADNQSDVDNVTLFGKCARMHGHTYQLEVFVEGPIDEITGMVLNYADLTKIVKPIVDRLDHQILNEIFDHLTTAELMVETIASWIEGAMDHAPFVLWTTKLVEVHLSETPKTKAIWIRG